MFRTLVSLTVLCVLVAAATPRSYGQKPQASPKDEEAKLIAVLKSDAPRKAKADACRELARVGTRESVAPLAALLCGMASPFHELGNHLRISPRLRSQARMRLPGGCLSALGEGVGRGSFPRLASERM